MKMLSAVIIALALLAGSAPGLVRDAHAAGFIEINPHDDLPYYFHGEGGAPRHLANGRYADVTIEMDGETVISDERVYNGRGGMGGKTTGFLDYKGKVYVKFVFYERDGRKIREDTWNRELKEGSNTFSHWDSTWNWGLYLYLQRTNPKAGDTRGLVDVSVRFD